MGDVELNTEVLLVNNIKYYPTYVGDKLHSFVTRRTRNEGMNDCIMHYDKKFKLFEAMLNDTVDEYLQSKLKGSQ